MSGDKTIRIVSTSGVGRETQVFLGDEQLRNVRSVTINVETDDIVTASVVFDCVEVDILPYKPERQWKPDPMTPEAAALLTRKG